MILDEIADEVRGSFELILRDEQHLARLTTFLQSRKEQTLRQVAGFLRGVEQACRDCAEHGTKLLEEKLSFWKTWRLILQPRAMAARFPGRSRDEAPRDRAAAGRKRGATARDRSARPLAAIAGHDRERSSLPKEKPRHAKTMPDFARQRRELLQSIQLTLVERIAGKGVEEQLARMFRESAAWLRLPAGVAAAGGIATVLAAMISASVADVTGIDRRLSGGRSGPFFAVRSAAERS